MRAITTFDRVTMQFQTIFDRSEPVVAAPKLQLVPAVTHRHHKRRVTPVWLVMTHDVLFHAWRAEK